MPQISIVIEGDERAAVQSVNNVADAMKGVESAQRSMGATSGAVSSAFTNQQQEARDAVRLLGYEVGVQMPRQLSAFLASSQSLAPVIAAAFDVTVIGGFATILATKVPEAIGKVIEGLTHQKQTAEALAKSHDELNKVIEQSVAKEDEFQKQLAEIGKTGADKIAADATSAHAVAARDQAHLNQLQMQLNLAKQVKAEYDEASNEALSGEGGFGAAAGLMAGQADAGVAVKKLEDQVDAQKETIRQSTNQALLLDLQFKSTWGPEHQKDIDDTTKKMEENRKKAQEIVDTFNVGSASVDEQYAANNKAIADALDKESDARSKVEQNIADGTAASIKLRGDEEDKLYNKQTEAAKKQLSQQEENARHFAEVHRQLTSEIAGFFDDVTSGQIGQRFKRMFEQLVAGMVADWILGTQSMSAASASGLGSISGVGGGGSGGGFGGILGSFFGLGGRGFGAHGAASGGSAGMSGIAGDLSPDYQPYDSGSLSSWGSGLSLSAGGGASSATTVLPAGASVGGGGLFGGSGGVFGGGALRTLLTAGGAIAGMSLVKSQNPLLRGLGGAGLGFGIGSAAGSILGGLAAPLIEAGHIGLGLGLASVSSLLPIVGPIVGGLVGLLSVLGPKHQEDRHQLEMQELSGIATVIQKYQGGSVTYDAAISALEQMKQQNEQQFSTWGASNHIADQVDSHIQVAEQQLSNQESQRQSDAARKAAIVWGPAQFEIGGPIGASARRPWMWAGAPSFAAGGAVPIIAHEGEWVMNRSAVQRAGPAKLAAMNNGGSAGGDTHIHFHEGAIQTMDAASFSGFLRNGGLKTLLREHSIARSEGRA